jgi:hypothetical protein
MSCPAYRMPSKGEKPDAGFAPASLLLPLIRARFLNALVRAIGATVCQVCNELAFTCALSNATLVPAPPLCVVVDAVQSASAVPIHSNPWLLVLSVAGALALLARRAELEASQITLKTHNMKHRKERP